MVGIVWRLFSWLCFGRQDVTDLVLENLALRRQLAVLQRSVKRPRLGRRDRAFWVLLSRIWRNWRSVLTIVQPDTVRSSGDAEFGYNSGDIIPISSGAAVAGVPRSGSSFIAVAPRP
jgi:hypothetical protein